jgi:hypothetical protein
MARSALQSLASARPEYDLDRTFGRISTAVCREADLPRAGIERLVVTQSGHATERVRASKVEA